MTLDTLVAPPRPASRRRRSRDGARRTVLFAGAYGVCNAGDDLPLIVMRRELERLAPEIDFDFRALARFPADWEQARYGVRMVRNLEFATRADSAGKWFRGLNAGDSPWPLLRLRAEFERADLVVLGAGNWITDLALDLFRGPIPLLALYVFLAQLHRVPVMLYGLSSIQLRRVWAQDLTTWVVRTVDVATVRDRETFDHLSALAERDDIEQLPDPALGGRPDPLADAQAVLRRALPDAGRARPIAVGVRALDRVLPEREWNRVREALLEACRSLLEHHPIVFVPQCTHPESDDRVEAAWYAERLGSSRVGLVEERLHPEALMAVYAECSLMIAIRLHAAVFAVTVGTPTLAIDYLPKVGSFMEGLGLEADCLDPATISGPALVRRAQELIVRPEPAREALAHRVAEKRARVRCYAERALGLLGAERTRIRPGEHWSTAAMTGR